MPRGRLLAIDSATWSAALLKKKLSKGETAKQRRAKQRRASKSRPTDNHAHEKKTAGGRLSQIFDK